MGRAAGEASLVGSLGCPSPRVRAVSVCRGCLWSSRITRLPPGHNRSHPSSEQIRGQPGTHLEPRERHRITDGPIRPMDQIFLSSPRVRYEEGQSIWSGTRAE